MTELQWPSLYATPVRDSVARGVNDLVDTANDTYIHRCVPMTSVYVFVDDDMRASRFWSAATCYAGSNALPTVSMRVLIIPCMQPMQNAPMTLKPHLLSRGRYLCQRSITCRCRCDAMAGLTNNTTCMQASAAERCTPRLQRGSSVGNTRCAVDTCCAAKSRRAEKAQHAT